MSIRYTIQNIINILFIQAVFMIIIVKSPILRVTYLCQVFILGSFIFILLDFYFLGLTYIIVYVGAIAILFIFTIMLLNIDLVHSENK